MIVTKLHPFIQIGGMALCAYGFAKMCIISTPHLPCFVQMSEAKVRAAALSAAVPRPDLGVSDGVASNRPDAVKASYSSCHAYWCICDCFALSVMMAVVVLVVIVVVAGWFCILLFVLWILTALL